MVIPVILAGGSGTRLWPLSRELHPKQLLDLVDKHTMLQSTVLRLAGFENMVSPMVICNENHRFMVAEQLRGIGVEPRDIILEPVGRNTAPALAVAAIRALDEQEGATLLVLPADHTIASKEALHQAMTLG
ncbi:MAG: NTP transferase domain-containing protein, partial [Desulfobacterales bacterium]|nr:NTP transferase domain-containing protein [Desulfobacterales bacterium]